MTRRVTLWCVAAHLWDMNTTRVPAGVPAGGQFAETTRPEAPVQLAPTSPCPVLSDRIRDAYQICERLVTRRVEAGSMTQTDRIEDVEHDLRAEFHRLPQAHFNGHLCKIGAIAERISVVESADAYDTDAYRDEAGSTSLELGDFPGEADEDAGYRVDHEAFHSAVIEELDSRMYRAISEFVHADTAAAVQPRATA